MKLKDGFYASSHGIGGLMLDMPTKNPKTRKKPKVKVGDMVRCEAEGFIYPFRGYVEHVYNHSAIIRIENGFESIPRTRFVRIFSRFQRVSISSF
ncbi:hypothetical protein, partial [Enterococcus faecium]|uniref:hypothetical protein n=1 Tax=Enterococcus faecium TaxID=1352 RepID=UPI001CE19A61